MYTDRPSTSNAILGQISPYCSLEVMMLLTRLTVSPRLRREQFVIPARGQLPAPKF